MRHAKPRKSKTPAILTGLVLVGVTGLCVAGLLGHNTHKPETSHVQTEHPTPGSNDKAPKNPVKRQEKAAGSPASTAPVNRTQGHLGDKAPAAASKPEVPQPQMQPAKGHGWNLSTDTGLTRNHTYVIAFGDAESVKTLKPYAEIGVNQLNAMPEMKSAHIKFALTDEIHPRVLTNPQCVEPYTYVFTMKHQAKGDNYYAATYACDVWVNIEDWASAPEYQKENIVTHEFGHLLGLDHCTKEAGLNPIMCEEGEPTPLERHGLFRVPDLDGIRQLIKRS